MTKQNAKFTNATGSKLTIYAKQGKKGIHVAATLKTPDQPAQTGCRQTFSNEAEATKAFQALTTEAMKNGWIAVIQTAGHQPFLTIPQANAPKQPTSAGKASSANKSAAA